MNMEIKIPTSLALFSVVLATAIIVSTFASAADNMVFANTTSSNSATAQQSDCSSSTLGDNEPISGSCNSTSISSNINTG